MSTFQAEPLILRAAALRADGHTVIFAGVDGKLAGLISVVDRIKAVKTGKKGFHGDVPLDDIIIERAEVV